MKHLLRPDYWLRLWILLLATTLVWAVTAQAPGDASGTNAPGSEPSLLTRSLHLADPPKAFVQENRSLLTFGLDRVEFLQTQLLHRPLWQYLATILYVIIALQVSRWLDWVIHTRLKRLAEKTATEWDDILIGLVDGPVKVVAFVLLLNIGLQLFDWPEGLEFWFSRLTLVAVAVSIVLVVLRAVDAAAVVWRRKLPDDGDRAFNDHFLRLVAKAAKIIITIVAGFTLMGHLGFDIRTALASVSVLGLALGLAAQDTVGNLFGAVAVFLDKPFKIGERVQIGEADGVVEEMGLRSTRLRTLDGFLLTVPNKEVGNSRIVNITRRPNIRTLFSIGLTYDTPAPRMQRAAELLEEILRNDPGTHDFIVHFNKFGDYFLNLAAVYWCKTTDYREYTRIYQRVNLTIKERFDAEGLRFAFPTQTIQVETGTAPQSAAPEPRT
ncbi:MAG: mechanosensitive ion channel family protein [Verrucomicrobiae bacterium]|nr:mechanosensitive ion channel family protein [Verrucomicrobiae bacterium]